MAVCQRLGEALADGLQRPVLRAVIPEHDTKRRPLDLAEALQAPQGDLALVQGEEDHGYRDSLPRPNAHRLSRTPTMQAS